MLRRQLSLFVPSVRSILVIACCCAVWDSDNVSRIGRGCSSRDAAVPSSFVAARSSLTIDRRRTRATSSKGHDSSRIDTANTNTTTATTTTTATSRTSGAASVFACGPDVGVVTLAGSSVIKPLAKIWADGYRTHCPKSSVSIETGGGSIMGARRVCAAAIDEAIGATPADIGMTVRMLVNGTEALTTNEVDYMCTNTTPSLSASATTSIRGTLPRSVTQIQVGWDGVALVVNPNGVGHRCLQSLGGGLTIDQVRWIFSNYSIAQLLVTGWKGRLSLLHSDNNDTTHMWSELSSLCTDNIEINIAGPDVRSGTYEMFAATVFTDAKNGESIDSRRGSAQGQGYYNRSTYYDIAWDLESGFIDTVYGDAIAILDLAYFVDPVHTANAEHSINLVGVGIFPRSIASGMPVVPNMTTVQNGDYYPLSRPLYWQVHTHLDSLVHARPFVQFALSNAGTRLLGFRYGGAIPLSLEDRNVMLSRLGAPNVSDSDRSIVPVLPPSPAPTRQCRPLFKRLLGICIEGCSIVAYILGFCKA